MSRLAQSSWACPHGSSATFRKRSCSQASSAAQFVHTIVHTEEEPPTMAIPLLDLKAQYRELQGELDAVWRDTMGSAAFIGGPRVKELEAAIADYVGSEHAVACANGTEALFLILAALDVGPGDEVITTPFSFFATVEAIVHVGARPVFVDIEPGTYNMDVSQLEAAVTGRSKAVMPVHIFGQCAHMDVVHDVATRHDLAVVEDACQAIGASYRDKLAGSLGDAAAFSFFPSKNLGGAGDGGIITTDREDIALRARKLANHGTSKKYFHDSFGVNSRLDALQAGILLAKLPYLNRWNAQRREAATYYQNALVGLPDLDLPVDAGYGEAVWHLFIVSSPRADDVIAALKEAEIGTALYYPLALHEQEALRTLDGYEQPTLPVAESCDGTTFALPCFPGITPAQQDEVVRVVREALS
jgi:dTDP-4-amino-4,6-dideoxygalactose transaminase